MTPATRADAKDLLLEDYRYRAEMMRESERAGETRVNLFIVLMTIVSAALVSLVTSDRPLSRSLELTVVLGALGSLLVFGWLTLLRLVRRNKSTDECKYSMDVIRQLFKDQFDEEGILLGYYPVNWPSQKPDDDRDPNRTKALRSFGGLAHLVASINAILAASMVATGMWRAAQLPQGTVLAISALTFVAALVGQVRYVTSKERRHNDELKGLQPTHAGGVVVKQEGDRNLYLLVRPRMNGHEWVLPKGHVKPGEGHGEAALREVKEETGVTASLLAPLGQWNFSVSGKGIRLKVYLMRHEEDEAGTENRELSWADVSASVTAATHPETKQSLRRAEQIIESLHPQYRTSTANRNH